MKTRSRWRLPYVYFSIAAYGLISLFFALMTGQIRRRGPDIYADTDPTSFRTRLIIYAIISFVGILVGLLLMLWQVWHSEE